MSKFTQTFYSGTLSIRKESKETNEGELVNIVKNRLV